MPSVDAVVVRVPSEPMVRAGKALKGRAGLVLGHEVMKAEAIE